MRVEVHFRGVLGLARKKGMALKRHWPGNIRVPWPPSLYGKVGLRTLDLHFEHTVNTRNFSFARAARATVGYPRVRKLIMIRAQKGRTTMAFSEAADSPPLPAGISHMGDSIMSCSPVLVCPSIAGPPSCAGRSMWS